MRIFHVASVADWNQAQESGTYTTSTRGRSLEEEGFLHAARREQVAGVVERYYADATEPLVVLEIETELLDVPWREEPVGDDTFPHIYGPLNRRAVVATQAVGSFRPPRPRPGRTDLNVAFNGVAAVLLVIAAVLACFAIAATYKAHSHVSAGLTRPASFPGWVPFLLWSLTFACAAGGATALMVAGGSRRPKP